MNEVWLAVIAVSTVVMAAVQVGIVIHLLRVSTRVNTLMGRLERDLEPTIARVNGVAEQASKIATLAGVQFERLDQTVSTLAVRMDDTVQTLHRTISGPAREGAALMAGVRATVLALRNARDARRRRVENAYGEDDDYLFI